MGFLAAKNTYQAEVPTLQQTDYQSLLNNLLQNNNQQQQQNLGNVNAQQSQLAKQLGAQAAGQGPNLANLLLQQGTAQNVQNAAGLASGMKGISPAQAARQILMNQANQGQQMAGQAAANQIQQQLGSQSALSSLLNQQGGLQLGQEQANNALLGTVGGLQQGQVGQNLQSQLGVQGINAGVAGQNTQAQNQLTGGILSGLAGMGAAAAGAPTKAWQGGDFKKGGKVPGKAPVDGDSPDNDVVDAKLSPGEGVIPRTIMQDDDAGEKAKEFIEAIKKGKSPKEAKDDAHGPKGYGKVLEKHRELKKKLAEIEKKLKAG